MHADVSHAEAVRLLVNTRLFWIPLLPLIAFVILILIGRRLGSLAPWLSVAALASAAGLTFSIAKPVFDGVTLSQRWDWLSTTNPAWSIGFAVDGLSWLMLFVVTVIGTMIQLYSIGYMHGDKRFSRFFAYLSLFCASMLGLVMADHFLLLFMCWELVGVCSYLLISFWFEKPAAAAAGRKAFLTTRVGDVGLLLGIFLLYTLVGDLRFLHLDIIRASLIESGKGGYLTLISALIFFGAVGKSAQIPLHVWLPDAMEGPTSVSALIHAATMVAAGVYLVARSFALFTPDSLQIVLVLGLVTHLLAATVALTMTDIKRVLAYSTLSQLGLMMVAMGLEARTAAMFHLYAHAFFKALMFLGAGSVIHAAHTQELGELGGLLKRMPWTGGLFLAAALSMCGLPFLSGFWSKDAILLAARESEPVVYWLLVLGATMTCCYVLRLWFRCFLGPEAQASAAHGGHGKHKSAHHASMVGAPSRADTSSPPRSHGAPGSVAHESPAIMVGPMAVLGIGALIAGLAGSPWMGNPLYHLLGDHHAHEHLDIPLLFMTAGILAVGGGLAWVVGFKRRNLLPEPLRPIGRLAYNLAAHKYYFDELYAFAIIRPFLSLTRSLSIFDGRVVDGAVNGAGRIGWFLGQWEERFDRTIVDGIVNGMGAVAQALGGAGRRLQTGYIQQYLLVVIIAAVTLSVLVQL